MTALTRHLMYGGAQGAYFGKDGVAPDPETGLIGDYWYCLMPGVGGTLVPTTYRKVAPADWGTGYTAPKGDTGNAGAAGSLAPWVTGSTYTADTNSVLIRQSVWQCAVSHTAGATFEADAVAGKWRIISASPVETFNPYLATSPKTLATAAPGRTSLQRTDGGGVIQNLMAYCSAGGGNYQLAVYRASAGVGSAPGDRVFQSALAAAATGPLIVSTGGLVVYPGDYLAIFTDSTTATFWTSGLGSNVFAAAMPGTSYFTNSTPQANSSGLTAATNLGPLIVGRS